MRMSMAPTTADKLLLEEHSRPSSEELEDDIEEPTSTTTTSGEYPFAEEDSDSNIAFEDSQDEGGVRKVKAGTLTKLVERITYEKYPDPNLLQAFLLTYRSFTTPKEFLTLLRQRFDVPTPPNLSPEELDNNKKNKVIVRLRCFNVCKNWVQYHFYDFQDHKELCDDFLDFIRNTIKPAPGMGAAAEQLERAIQRKLEGKEEEKTLIFNKKPPPPILPTTPGPWKFEDLNIEEVARQLTLIEFELYKAIKPWECLNQAWTKKTTPPKAPNILATIGRFNRVSEWCKTEIVRTENFKARTQIIGKFIELAEVSTCFKTGW
jgi:son of sevenless-like protein